jgi:hypothetical protein
VSVNTGVKVASVDVANSSIRLEDGSTVSADVIIAADGVHVSERSSLLCFLYSCYSFSSVLCPSTGCRWK